MAAWSMLIEPSASPCRCFRRALFVLPVFLVLSLFPAEALPQDSPCVVTPGFFNPQSTLTTQSDHRRFANNVLHLRGHVVIDYRDMRITADRATYNRSTGSMEARGHVVFDDPRGHLEAQYLNYNVYSDRGWFSKVRGYIRFPAPAGQPTETSTQLFMRAERIDRLDPDTYTIQDVHVSTCRKESHGLAFGLGSAKLEIGHALTGREAVFRFLGIPVLYLPFVAVSAARNPRQSGFLLPQIGENTQKGFEIGDGFFWAINPSADLLLGAEDYSLRGLGFSGRFRARPSETSSITANFFAIDDHATSKNIIHAPGGSFEVIGTSGNLGDGFRGVVDASYVNSLAFRETWAENFNTAVFSEARQTGFATKSFGPYSMNFYASRYQDFLSATPVNPAKNSVIIRQAPSVSFSGIDTELGRSPFFFAFDTSGEAVGRSEPGFSTPTLTSRIDFFPRITWRVRPFWDFHLTPTFGIDETYYGTSLRPDHAPVNRLIAEASVDLRPPSFEKTFTHPLWGRRFKHVIEPDIRYRLLKPTDPQDIFDIVRFDTMDLLTDDNEIEYSLTNSLLERKDVPAGEAPPPARDLLSLTISQKYFFDPTFGGTTSLGSQIAIQPALSLTGFSFPEGRRWSPVDSVLMFSPVSRFDAEFRTDIDPQGGGLLNAGITSRIQEHSLDLALTDFFVNHTELLPAPIAPAIPPQLRPSFNLLDVIASYSNPRHKRWTEGFRLDYNLAQGIVEDFVGQASYNFGCFGLNAQYERFNLGAIRNENTFRLSITLGRIGTFGSLRPGQFLQRQLQQIP